MQGAQGMLVQNWPTVSSAAGEMAGWGSKAHSVYLLPAPVMEAPCTHSDVK